MNDLDFCILALVVFFQGNEVEKKSPRKDSNDMILDFDDYNVDENGLVSAAMMHCIIASHIPNACRISLTGDRLYFLRTNCCMRELAIS